MKALTDFGTKIKMALITKNKTQKWLQEQVTQTTGLFFDSSYMHKILVGEQKNANIINAIKKILEIKE